jgi:hypothetical protein
MAEETCIVSVDDPDRWTAEHEAGGLPSQSWGYARALSASGIEPKLGVVHSGGARMLVPFFEREWMGRTDIATIQGLSGASISPSSAAPLSLWRQYAAAQGWVAGYIQVATSVDLTGECLPADELVSTHSVFLLDLRARDPLDSASRIVRRKVRRAARLGAALVEDRSALSTSLKSLYPSAMRRLGAAPNYLFSTETLERWALDPSSLVLGARVGDLIEAVSVFSVAGRRAEAHINATTEGGRDLTAWLLSNGITRLRDRGVEVLNLGGGVRPGDGVHRFKERFNVPPTPLYAVRQVYDAVAYEELCRRAGVAPTGQYFPAYRPESLA